MHKSFAYHKPFDDGLARITRLREAYSALLETLEEVSLGPSREQSLAVTNLETSAMWAVKSVVSNDPESEVSL